MNKQSVTSEKFIYRVEDIFKEYYAPLCYFAMRYIADEQVAEDIVQDMFAMMIERQPELESSIHLKNFLYISIKNACRNHIRQGYSQERYVEAKNREHSVEESLEQRIIATEVYKELAAAVAGLPAECRKVFEACYYEGLDNEKAAAKLGISIFTVKAQKARGKKILRENLRELFPLLATLFEFFLEDV